MNITDLIKTGQLAQARKELVEQVRSAPADTIARTLLFQVLLFCGEWEKASRHLEALASMDKEANPAFVHYAGIISGEQERLRVIRGATLPSFLPKTPPYFDIYFQACAKLKDHDIAGASKLFSQAEGQMATISGTVNGKQFTGLRNTDTTLAWFLETFAHGRYVWVPFAAIRELTISPPATLLDLIWATAGLTTWEGLTLNCTLPVLYPESCRHENDLVKMGKRTEWLPLGGSFCQGSGQQVFTVGEEDLAILEISEMQFHYNESGGNA